MRGDETPDIQCRKKFRLVGIRGALPARRASREPQGSVQEGPSDGAAAALTERTLLP